MLLSLFYLTPVVLSQEPQASCFTIKFENGRDGFRCTRAETPQLNIPYAPKWPTVLGIGPAKTGSSSLGHRLDSAPNVLVGHNHAGGIELGWLSNEGVVNGIMGYAKHFNHSQELSPEFVQAYEKTPGYSGHPLVPYRARAFMSTNLKLLFSTRTLFELDASLYLFKKANTLNFTYHGWLHARLKSYDNWVECRRKAFELIMLPASDGTVLTIDDIYNTTYFSPESTSIIEGHIYKECGLCHDNTPGNCFVNVMIVSNLRRWIHAFPNRDNILCVDISQRIDDPIGTLQRINEFLGIKDQSVTSKDGERGNSHADISTFDRIVESQMELTPDRSRNDIEREVAELRDLLHETGRKYVPCSDIEFFKDVCGYYPLGYDYC